MTADSWHRGRKDAPRALGRAGPQAALRGRWDNTASTWGGLPSAKTPTKPSSRREAAQAMCPAGSLLLCLQPSPSEGHHMEEADCWGSAFRTEDRLPLCPPCEQANPLSSSDSKYCKGQLSELRQGSCWATSHQASPQVRPGQKRWEGNHVPVGSHETHNQTTPFSVPCALPPEPAGSAAAGAAPWCQCRVPGTCPSVQPPELKSDPSPDGKACKGTGNLSGELHKVFASSTEQT